MAVTASAIAADSTPGTPPPLVTVSDSAVARALARGLDEPLAAPAARLAEFLARAFGPATAALVHYGSHMHDGGAPAGSAWDFFVIVDAYAPAYRALATALPGRIRPGRATWLNRVLPPNVVSVEMPGPELLLAKCCVLTRADLVRACGPRPHDHFVRARLFQPVRLAWMRDEQAAHMVTAAIVAARAATFGWVRPFLLPAFDANGYARRLLEVSYAAEIRPEDDERVEGVFAAQRATLIPLAGTLLESLAARGALVRDGARWRDPRPPGPLQRFLARRWFGWSKLRATLRWAKYVALYEGWLEYLVGKIERRSGERMTLTERERRWPLLFLWPRALRYLGRRTARPRG